MHILQRSGIALRIALALWVGIALLLAAPAARAANVSFAGTVPQDDAVQLFSFTADGASNVSIIGFGYAGGINASATSISRGGFDTIIAIYDSTGLLIGHNDDGAGVGTDAVTGAAFDSFVNLGVLAAGTYTLALTVFDNFPIGPGFADGFGRAGQGNFTAGFSCPDAQAAFNDVSGVAGGCGRNGNWALDVLGVESASLGDLIVPAAIPEPATFAVLVTGLAGLSLVRRRRG